MDLGIAGQWELVCGASKGLGAAARKRWRPKAGKQGQINIFTLIEPKLAKARFPHQNP